MRLGPIIRSVVPSCRSGNLDRVPDSSDRPWANSWCESRWLRVTAYAVVLVALGAWANFHRLGERMLCGDEAAFAYTTDTMLATGEWVVPYLPGEGGNTPHLNATPLYNWLCVLTARWTGEGYLRYRLWAAIFGVACVLATLVLGTLLFRPEVGFLAGLILQLNHGFLVYHGFRDGVMEPGLTFFITATVICYVQTHLTSKRTGLWWALMGLSLGGAVLIKPPAMGGFFFLAICAHNLIARRDVPLVVRLRGPLLALAVAGLVSLPWYAAISSRLGTTALKTLFIYNSIGRAVSSKGEGADLPTSFYLQLIGISSRAFQLAAPAVLFALVWAGFRVSGKNRLAWGLPALLAAVYLLAISSATTKHGNYVYPVFPLFSVLVAALLLIGVNFRRAQDLNVRWRLQVVAVAGIVLSAVLVLSDFQRVANHFRSKEPCESPLLRFHDAMRENLAGGQARLVLYRYPLAHQDTPGFSLGDLPYYYTQFRLPYATHARSVQELRQLLADGTPTVVFLPPLVKYEDITIGTACPVPDRSLRVRSELLPYPALLFNGAESRCHLEDLLGSGNIEFTEAAR